MRRKANTIVKGIERKRTLVELETLEIALLLLLLIIAAVGSRRALFTFTVPRRARPDRACARRAVRDPSRCSAICRLTRSS